MSACVRASSGARAFAFVRARPHSRSRRRAAVGAGAAFVFLLALAGPAAAQGVDGPPRAVRGDPRAHVVEEITRAKSARASGLGLGRSTPVERGRRIFSATGGCTCHTNYPGEGSEAPILAGGRALETPFGIFFSTNITPDRETGIGAWSNLDFLRAMREGLAPDGSHYFPVFPYTAFTGLSDSDLMDMKAYLDSLPAIRRANRVHDTHLPFSWRPIVAGWKWLHFEPARVASTASEGDADDDPALVRGRYLVLAAAHCGECHTPRTLTGGLDATRWLAGSRDGPEGQLAPNITPDERTGIGSWSIPDLVWYLETGQKPEGDDTQGLMGEVIRHGYAHLPREDREAIAHYLKSIPAIENRVKSD